MLPPRTLRENGSEARGLVQRGLARRQPLSLREPSACSWAITTVSDRTMLVSDLKFAETPTTRAPTS